MFHQDDNLYFGRLPDGAVRILKFAQRPHRPPNAEHVYDKQRDGILFDVTIPAGHWASAVAFVSAQGEGNGRYYLAKHFHDDLKTMSTPNARR